MVSAYAPRSAASYIGSLITLTSKCEIRYEGVLSGISTGESIALRNVRSFGTEGRKKDEPQIPPSDKIYESILFRTSDIKVLKVLSSPPIHPTPTVHNDPAIIQSHYPNATSASTTVPSDGSGYVPDLVSQTEQTSTSRAAYMGGFPLYQPSGSLGTWDSSCSSTTNSSGLGIRMHWQGFHPAGGLSHLQPPLLRPVGLQLPSSMQQATQYPLTTTPLLSLSSSLPGTDASLPSGPLNFPVENPSVSAMAPTISSLFPPSSLPSTLFPSSVVTNQVVDFASEMPSTLLSNPSMSTGHAPIQPPSTINLPFASSIPKPELDPASSNLDPIPVSNMTYQSTANSLPSSTSTLPSSTQLDVLAHSLVTPAQLLQSGAQSMSSSHPPETNDKESEKLKEVEESEEGSAESKPTVAGFKEPILPLPQNHKANGVIAHACRYNYHRSRGRGRGRGNELARSATKFVEDFDFEAMNEKFNKEEVWGHLGKTSGSARERDKNPVEDAWDPSTLEDHAGGFSKPEIRPVYTKDDFFDSLSCQSLEHSNRTRTRFSEQRKVDSETFGEFQRDQRYRGRGFRGGWARGSFHGRGHGYAGRARGYSATNYRF